MMNFFILIPVILYAVTVHEYAHGWIAYKLGDGTARSCGRLSLNPIKHLDPIGTLMFIFLRVGFAKPVPVNALNFKNPRKGMLLVGIAGPLANLLSAFVFGLMFRLLVTNAVLLHNSHLFTLLQFLATAIMLNLALAVFNFLPIFPLDGSHIIKGLLPPKLAYQYSRYNRQLMAVLVAAILLSHVAHIPILGFIVWPPVDFLSRLFSGTSLHVLENILTLTH